LNLTIEKARHCAGFLLLIQQFIPRYKLEKFSISENLKLNKRWLGF
jgi:hypothetical protein